MRRFRPIRHRAANVLLAGLLTSLAGIGSAQTPLSSTPASLVSTVPANLMLTLSVEFPTGDTAAYNQNNISSYATYTPGFNYIGYFDGAKCYAYQTDSNGYSYFVPQGYVASGVCATGYWSGNLLNWATMAVLDEFRQALSGGNRMMPDGKGGGVMPTASGNPADTANLTVLLRTYVPGGGSFPGKSVNPAGLIGDSQFSGASSVTFNSESLGTQFTVTSGSTSVTYNAAVQVCVPGMLESNCNNNPANTYPGSGKYAKPEGLIQQNYQRIRVGASGYPFRDGQGGYADGAVRALLHDSGPDRYNGTQARLPNNPNAEWDSKTGIFAFNPDSSDIAIAITSSTSSPPIPTPTTSGTINYLNQFGYTGSGGQGNYEIYDVIGEVYWASLAYLMNAPLDSGYLYNGSHSPVLSPEFPIFTGNGKNTTDPMQYSCHTNALVVIGDIHTWRDAYVPGDSSLAAITAINGAALNPALNARQFATYLGNLPLIEGQTFTMAQALNTSDLGSVSEPGSSNYATYYMAGMAYYAHIKDIRPDLPGKQTVDTYVVDVLESGAYATNWYGSPNLTSMPTGIGSNGPSLFWLTAKYGGFTDTGVTDSNGNGIPPNMASWHTNTSSGYQLHPDNYFPGNQPQLIQNGLMSIFNKVASTPSSAAGPALTANKILTNIAGGSVAPYYSPVAGFPVYGVSYIASGWTGDTTGAISSASGSSIAPVAGSLTWDAQTQLDTLAHAAGTSGALGWDTGRRIITSTRAASSINVGAATIAATTDNAGNAINVPAANVGGSAGIPFRWASLTAAEQSALGSIGGGTIANANGCTGATPGGCTLLNYLRGDQSNENTAYRARTHLLGDIVHSQPVLVQSALSSTYSDAFNPGYADFSNAVTNRPPVVYVGANDGMLHAFEADFVTPPGGSANTVYGGGSEMFAYVPGFLFQGPSAKLGPTSTPTAATNGLAALAILNNTTTTSGGTPLSFSHQFYVDQTPQVADVDFSYALYGANAGNGSPPNQSASGYNPNWQTILVGGLGAGGQGFYALNVTAAPPKIDATTSSSGASNEAQLARQALWEFPNAGTPSSVDIGYSFGAPLIVKTRRYGWVVLLTSGYNNASGHGHLYVVALDGTLLTTLTTPDRGSATNPSGLAQAVGYTANVADNTVEQVYAGDLLGNVWRFDLSCAPTACGSGNNPFPAPTLLAQLTDANGNPQPITTAPAIGLGIGASDTMRWVFVGTGRELDSSDLTSTQQQTMYALIDGTGTAPATTDLPLSRADLTALTASELTASGITLPTSGAGAAGWYYDLGAATGIGSERIIINPVSSSNLGVLSWATAAPSIDPCNVGGNIYAVNFATGISALTSSAGTPMVSLQAQSAPTALVLAQLPGSSQISLIYGQASGQTQVATLATTAASATPQRVNWQEIK